MRVRLPNVRQPRSFYDVFGVAIAAMVTTGLVLTARYGPGIRFEMAVFVTIVFLWTGRAIDGIFAHSEDGAGSDRTPPRNGQRK